MEAKQHQLELAVRIASILTTTTFKQPIQHMIHKQSRSKHVKTQNQISTKRGPNNYNAVHIGRRPQQTLLTDKAKNDCQSIKIKTHLFLFNHSVYMNSMESNSFFNASIFACMAAALVP